MSAIVSVLEGGAIAALVMVAPLLASALRDCREAWLQLRPQVDQFDRRQAARHLGIDLEEDL